MNIEEHNKPLIQAMFDRGCEWTNRKGWEYFTLNGKYESFPIGYIRGPLSKTTENY
jgi:hypothetical protein